MVEQVIEDLVYEHVVDLVDFDRMYELEQIVELRLGELVGLSNRVDTPAVHGVLKTGRRTVHASSQIPVRA